MSGDLISKSALLEEMRKFVGNQRYLISEEVWNMAENAPIAYDVDRVVEQLELLSENMENSNLNTYEEKAAYCTAYNKAIDIVKEGGVNEQGITDSF